MKRMLRVSVVAIFSIFLMSGTALALPVVIDFEQGLTSGGIIQSDLLVGSNIPLTVLKVAGLTEQVQQFAGNFILNYSVYNNMEGYGIIVSGTGDITSEIDGKKTVLMSLDANQWLLRGTISKYDTIPLALTFIGQGPDRKNPELLEALNIPLDTEFEFLDFASAFSRTTRDGTYDVGTYGAISVDVKNTQIVPEPASMLLLGLGLVGLAGVGRRFKKK